MFSSFLLAPMATTDVFGELADLYRRRSVLLMVANMWLPPILTLVRIAEPSIQIELLPSDRNQYFLRRDADIAIRMVDPTRDALIAGKLGDVPVGLYGAQSHFARRGRVAMMQDLLQHDGIASTAVKRS